MSKDMILTRNPKVYSDIDIETIERYECDAGLAGSDSIQAEMRAERPGIRNYTLQPGEIYLGRGPAVVTTILGSCVAVTMHDAKSGISAICHGLLPSCSRAEPCKDSCPEKFKFVECSIKKMLDKFDSCGINRAGIEVKMFGGSDMFGVQSDPMNRTVGRDNIKVAQETIEAGGLQIAASDTGGNLGRKIIFITHTGDVFLKRLVKS